MVGRDPSAKRVNGICLRGCLILLCSRRSHGPIGLLITRAGLASPLGVVVINASHISFDVAVQFAKFEIEPDGKGTVEVLVVGGLVELRSASIGGGSKVLAIGTICYQRYGGFFV